MSEKNLHEQLKNWLINLGKSMTTKRGKPYYSKVWSGDSESVVIHFKQRHDVCQPDVVWKHRNEKCIFEIAFTEGWREIAGEITLASMAEDCVKVLIITYLPEDATSIYQHRWKQFVQMVGEKVGLKYGAQLIFIPHNLYAENKIGEIKTLILTTLKERNWVW